jgi:hypothetical protein
VYRHCPFTNDLEVVFEDNEVSISQSYLSKDKYPCYDKVLTEDGEWIVIKLKELYMGEWKEMYEPEDCIVNDGTNWQLTMEFIQPNETVIIRGNNAYPYNFDEFLSIFDAEHFIDEDAYREGFWNIK